LSLWIVNFSSATSASRASMTERSASRLSEVLFGLSDALATFQPARTHEVVDKAATIAHEAEGVVSAQNNIKIKKGD
jgi:hypothetical protein